MNTTKEQILEAAADCPQAKETLKTLFPDAFKKEVIRKPLHMENELDIVDSEGKSMGFICKGMYNYNEDEGHRYLKLHDEEGEWYNSEGNNISGYIYFKYND